MYNTTHLSLPTGAERIFNFLLHFYPQMYRKQYGNEIRLLFTEMYHDELVKNGRVRLGFWFSQIGDITKSVIEQHIDLIQKKGMKKYLQQTLHINIFNIIGSIFLLPAFIVLSIDIISRIVQGDLVHYNRPVYNLLSHTPLYWQPVLFTWVIVFPFLAILLNVIPLIKNITKNHGHIRNMRFLGQNLITIVLFIFATFFILLIKFHDFGPCMLHGLARLGFEHFTHIVAVCKNV